MKNNITILLVEIYYIYCFLEHKVDEKPYGIVFYQVMTELLCDLVNARARRKFQYMVLELMVTDYKCKYSTRYIN